MIQKVCFLALLAATVANNSWGGCYVGGNAEHCPPGQALKTPSPVAAATRDPITVGGKLPAVSSAPLRRVERNPINFSALLPSAESRRVEIESFEGLAKRADLIRLTQERTKESDVTPIECKSREERPVNLFQTGYKLLQSMPLMTDIKLLHSEYSTFQRQYQVARSASVNEPSTWERAAVDLCELALDQAIGSLLDLLPPPYSIVANGAAGVFASRENGGSWGEIDALMKQVTEDYLKNFRRIEEQAASKTGSKVNMDVLINELNRKAGAVGLPKTGGGLP